MLIYNTMPKFLLLENLMKKGINLSKRDYMISYLKNKFDFMGVMTPHRKLALKEFYKDYNPSNRIENNQFIDRLWNENEREYQHCALEIYFHLDMVYLLMRFPISREAFYKSGQN